MGIHLCDLLREMDELCRRLVVAVAVLIVSVGWKVCVAAAPVCKQLEVPRASKAECEGLFKSSEESEYVKVYNYKQNGDGWDSTKWRIGSDKNISRLDISLNSEGETTIECITADGHREWVHARCAESKVCITEPPIPVADDECKVLRPITPFHGFEKQSYYVQQEDPAWYCSPDHTMCIFSQQLFSQCQPKDGTIKCRSYHGWVKPENWICTDAADNCSYLWIGQMDTAEEECRGMFRLNGRKQWVRFEMVEGEMVDTEYHVSLVGHDVESELLTLKCWEGSKRSSAIGGIINLRRERCTRSGGTFCKGQEDYKYHRTPEQCFFKEVQDSEVSPHCNGVFLRRQEFGIEWQRFATHSVDHEFNVKTSAVSAWYLMPVKESDGSNSLHCLSRDGLLGGTYLTPTCTAPRSYCLDSLRRIPLDFLNLQPSWKYSGKVGKCLSVKYQGSLWTMAGDGRHYCNLARSECLKEFVESQTFHLLTNCAVGYTTVSCSGTPKATLDFSDLHCGSNSLLDGECPLAHRLTHGNDFEGYYTPSEKVDGILYIKDGEFESDRAHWHSYDSLNRTFEAQKECHKQEAGVDCEATEGMVAEDEFVCATAADYCPFLTVTRVDVADDSVVGHYRMIAPGKWTKFGLRSMDWDFADYFHEESHEPIQIYLSGVADEYHVPVTYRVGDKTQRIDIPRDGCTTFEKFCFNNKVLYPSKFHLQSSHTEPPSHIITTTTPQPVLPTQSKLITTTPQPVLPTQSKLITTTPQPILPTQSKLITTTPQPILPTQSKLITTTPQPVLPTASTAHRSVCDSLNVNLELMYIQEMSMMYCGEATCMSMVDGQERIEKQRSLQKNIPSLFRDLEQEFASFKVGYAEFTDKGIEPLGQENRDFCTNFINSMTPLTCRYEEFIEDHWRRTWPKSGSGRDMLENQLDAIISSVLKADYTESDFDADGKMTLRVAFVVTDKGFHTRGDVEERVGCELNGADICKDYDPLEVNGCQCVGYEYPTVDQLLDVLQHAKVNPLFYLGERRDILTAMYSGVGGLLTQRDPQLRGVTVAPQHEGIQTFDTKRFKAGLQTLCAEVTAAKVHESEGLWA